MQQVEQFINYCQKGDLINAKKYFEENPNIDIHEIYEYAFRWSCLCGRLEVAKWLWSLNQNINIHANNEYTFRQSCEFGHLEVAKWLLSLNQNIDIHAKNEAFRRSCERGRLKFAKWLSTLCDNYYLEHDDNKIIYWKILTEQEIEEKKIFTKKLNDLANLKIIIDYNTVIEI